MKLDEILKKLAVGGYFSGSCDTDDAVLKTKTDILKWVREQLPEKKELDDCGVVKEVCYGYNQAEKGYNQAIDEIKEIFK